MKAIYKITFTAFILSLFIISTHQVNAEETVKIIVKYNESDEVVRTQSSKSSFEVIETTKSQKNSVMKELESAPNVDYVEEDAPVYLMNSNDPEFNKQRGYLSEVSTTDAWNTYVQKGDVVVAVLDTGVDLDHPDLKGNLVKGINLHSKGETAQDNEGHGTHVSGLIGATTNNGIGIASISKGVKIMPIKVMDGNVGQMSAVVEGIEYAINHGADIINLSLGSYSNLQSMKDVIDKASQNGVLVVAAAGNDNLNKVRYPAAYESTIAVGATNTGTDEKGAYSNYSADIDLNTPGTDIYSTWLDGYNYSTGTSMSSALVSSAAGMVMQHAPFLTADQVRNILISTTDPIEDLNELGTGRLNVVGAINSIKNNNRLYGENAVETAIAVSQNGWSELSEKEVVLDGANLKGKFAILASGLTFPDSLAASPLSTYLDAPILLQQKKSLSAANKEELYRLGVTHVVIVGGSGAVSNEIEDQLVESGMRTIRLSGKDRYETSVAINEAIPFETDEAMIASGENFPDALSIAPYAGKMQTPVLFVQKNKVPAEVVSYLKNNRITESYTIGGEGVITSHTTDSLGVPTTRISGKDRYETNYQVIKRFNSSYLEHIYIATGTNFPDALVGGALSSKKDSPIMLTHPDKLLPEVSQELTYLRNRGANSYNILGGYGAISVELAWTIDHRLLY
ncbi:cell wall-binding repeat-containing protein [Alkalihalobacillus sp. CinArs1]|uniref:cell wall-binding repeat-containing protein n=1 Tax=Alkalihalobacillus sp. CinArs1 TaxID=2995314 RepID=UPI0022DE592C|nr:cell wall-binding repeat-containing protein [Alkalihalobacillus sp. CinArs1]